MAPQGPAQPGPVRGSSRTSGWNHKVPHKESASHVARTPSPPQGGLCNPRAPTHHQSCVTLKDTGYMGGSLALLQRPEGRMDCVLRPAAVS